MSNMRVLPPAPPAGSNTVTSPANGRSFTCAAGSFLDVLSGDALVLGANGWTIIGFAGPTAERPSPTRSIAADNDGIRRYFDTSLGKTIYHDGAIWRDHAGTAV